MNGLTQQLMPVQVLAADGSPIDGKVMYQLNRTKDGWLVTLINNQGVDKTQHGIARVDRKAYVDVLLRTKFQLRAAREFTELRDIPGVNSDKGTEIRVRVHPGDVQVIGLVTG